MAKEYGKNRNKTALILALLVLLAAALSACGGEEESIQETPELLTPVGVNLDTEPVKRGDVVNQVAYEAEVIPMTRELYFSVDGRIMTILAYRGQEVKEGDPLIVLDQTSVLAEISSIEEQLADLETDGSYADRIADLKISYCEVELQEALERSGEGSQDYQLKYNALLQARLQKEQAAESRELSRKDLEAKLSELQETASEQTLYAPCDGTFYCLTSISEGSYVSSGHTAAYVVDPSELRVLVSEESVSTYVLEQETYYGWIGGQRWELQYEPLSAEEKSSYALAKKVVPTYFSIQGDWEESITAGMNAAVMGELRREKDVLYVPVESLLSDGGGKFVYVITNGTDREKRYVKIGYSNGLYTVIEEGLEEGEMVYVEE